MTDAEKLVAFPIMLAELMRVHCALGFADDPYEDWHDISKLKVAIETAGETFELEDEGE